MTRLRTTLMPTATDPRLSSFVQQLDLSPGAGRILRLLVSDPGRSFTAGELAAWTGASDQETARCLDLLAGAGLAWMFELNRQAQVLVSPLPLMQQLARQITHVMASESGRAILAKEACEKGSGS